MKHSLKAALLSALIFPGMGHVALKYYGRGAVLMLTVLASLSVVVVNAVQQAFAILEKIESEGGVISLRAIQDAATQASTTSVGLMLNLLSLFIVLCWIVGVVDAYRIGRKRDIAEGSTSQASPRPPIA